MFDLVIFDCDGVLIDSEIISAQMLVDALAGLGVTIDLPYVARHFLGRSYPTVMAQIRAEFGLDLPPEFEDAYRARLMAAFEVGLRVMPGVRAVLEGLALPWCVATSSSPMRAARSLQIAGLSDLVGGGLYTATMVARGKPAPDLFLHVAADRGVEPARCLVIEDSLNGVRAGLAAGMAVWRFTGGSHLAGQTLDAPEDARAAVNFASFDAFFDLSPALPRHAKPRRP
jgi:HAD superfamily hydrolase (TIGR01509 family)